MDPDGTCRIYYGAMPPDLSFEQIFYHRLRETTEISNVELHYHLQPENPPDRHAFPTSLPSMFDFKHSCPIWHFVNAANEKGPKPTCNITIAFEGKGRFPYDYNTMLDPLVSLWESLTPAGFEHVVVKLVPATRYDGSKYHFPSEVSMSLLRNELETLMGSAKVTLAGEECHMEFSPRHLAEI